MGRSVVILFSVDCVEMFRTLYGGRLGDLDCGSGSNGGELLDLLAVMFALLPPPPRKRRDRYSSLQIKTRQRLDTEGVEPRQAHARIRHVL